MGAGDDSLHIIKEVILVVSIQAIKGGLLMAGEKQTVEIELNNDHVTFMRIMKDDYNIPTESKVMRIIMDYLQENNDVHDTVFKQTRCLRCE